MGEAPEGGTMVLGGAQPHDGVEPEPIKVPRRRAALAALGALGALES
jgi:hypothetical protein